MLSELKVDQNAVTIANSYTFTNVVSNHTITATFSPISYTISYELDGGLVTGNPASYTIESEAITIVNPTKEGYTFIGWTGTGLTEATTTVTIPKGSTGNRTYTANWKVANVAPTTPTVTLSNKTTSSFTVRAVSTDANGDSLTYKLYVDGKSKATSNATPSGTSVILKATGLDEYTNYNYFVKVSDGKASINNTTVNIRTYCSGRCQATKCELNYDYCSIEECDMGFIKCTNTSTYSVASPGRSYARCSNCSSSYPTLYGFYCTVCNTRLYSQKICDNCGNAGDKEWWVSEYGPHEYNCSNCDAGYIYHECSEHTGYNSAHYYCSKHNYVGTSYYHECEHGYSSQHD